jgi:dipeptidyl aminopeptidase/acylaminoacyl peptidase
LSTYAFDSAQKIVCTYSERGSHLAILDTTTHALDEIKTPYTSMANPRISNGRVAFIAGSASQPSSLILLDLKTRKLDVLRRSSEIKIDPGYISTPQAIEFPTENKLTAHAIYYPPANKSFAAPKNENPPLIVKSHGGPTSATGTTLNLGIQYWTSRGFAVVDVNYGGSTGYGRKYRERLNGTWGVVDVDDCVNAARHLVEKGLADGKRMAITGGSAGGYTTLTAIALRDVFTAAASHFGIGDLEVFAKDTHKYESRYLDRLVGPYPEKRDVYRARSAMNFVDNINCPLILFQGLEDKIVPPNQSQMMFDAVKKKGLPCAYVAFEGEQHGFRQAKNIKRSLDGELYFYSKVFGFELADKVEPVKIENLPGAKPKAQSQKRKVAGKKQKAIRGKPKAASTKKKTTSKKRKVAKRQK